MPKYLSHALHRCQQGLHGLHVRVLQQILRIMLLYGYKYVAGKYTTAFYVDNVQHFSELLRSLSDGVRNHQ